MAWSPLAALPALLEILWIGGRETGGLSFPGWQAGGKETPPNAEGTRRDAEYQAFWRRDLSESDFVYVWVDRIHFNIRLEDDRLCTLAVLGVRADGTKELVVAREDDYRESADSWASVLRDLRQRAWLLGCGARRLAADDPATRLVPQDGQRARTSSPNAFGRGPSGNGAHLLPLVRAGVPFIDGVLEERCQTAGGPEGGCLITPDSRSATFDNISLYLVNFDVRESLEE